MKSWVALGSTKKTPKICDLHNYKNYEDLGGLVAEAVRW